MLRLLVLASLLPLALATPALAQGSSGAHSNAGVSGSAPPVSSQDRGWLEYAATDNQGEIQESLLAEKKAQSLAVKAFVRLMVDDHVQIESRLANVLNQLSVSVPNGPGQKAEKLISELNSLHGAEFDRRFMQEQIKDHEEDVQKFSDEIRSTGSDDIKRFAAETLPVLKEHLALAEAVQASLSGPGRSPPIGAAQAVSPSTPCGCCSRRSWVGAVSPGCIHWMVPVERQASHTACQLSCCVPHEVQRHAGSGSASGKWRSASCAASALPSITLTSASSFHSRRSFTPASRARSSCRRASPVSPASSAVRATAI